MAQFNQSFTGGAVDLGEVARQAEARRELEGGQFEPFITVDEKTVETHAFERSMQVPVVLLLGSARSQESENLKATFAKLAAGQRGFMVAYVDADATPQLAQMLGVRALPTAVALAAGRPVTSFEGDQPEEQLTQWVQTLVSNIGPQLRGLDGDAGAGDQDAAHTQEPDDPRLDAAAAALESGDFDAALAAYDEVISDQAAPAELRAEVTRAKAAVTVMRRAAIAEGVDEGAGEVGVDKHLASALAAADTAVLAGDAEGAFGALLPLVKAHPEAKERLIELFALFEPGDPRVKAARTALASALF